MEIDFTRALVEHLDEEGRVPHETTTTALAQIGAPVDNPVMARAFAGYFRRMAQ
jgi:hypothetical protein